MRTIIDTGSWQADRAGIRTIGIPGAMMRVDLQKDGLPARLQDARVGDLLDRFCLEFFCVPAYRS